MTRLTKEHFDFFKKECLRFQKELGLTEYRFYFKWDSPDRTRMAAVCTSFSGKVATFFLGRKWDDPVTKKELTDTALHECFHVLLEGLIYIGKARYVNDGEFETENELVVGKLISFYFNK